MSPTKFVKRVAGGWRAIAGAALAAITLVAVLLSWEISHVVQQSHVHATNESTIPFTVQAIDRPLPPQLEPVGSPAAFRDAAMFHGRLYVAGPHGVVEYDANGVPLRRLRPGLELPPAPAVSVTVGALATDAEPELMIGTAGEGLLLFDGRRLRQMRAERPEYRRLTATLALSAGRVLLGTGKLGLLVYDGRRLMLAHPLLANVPVTTLAGTDGDLWIGTLDRGVLHWRGGNVERFDESAGLPDPRVLSIASAGDRTYVGTALGVAEFRDGRYTRSLGPGLFASAVAVRNDTLLIGTLEATLAKIPLAARTSRGARPIINDTPGAIERFFDADGGLYALGSDSLYSMDDRTLAPRRLIEAEHGQLSDRNVSALAVHNDGRLWVGYFDRGLDILDAKGARASHVETDRVFCVNRIVHDAQGRMTAVATANGLVLFDPSGRQKQVLGRAEGLIVDHVTDLVLTADRMMIATPAGVSFLEPEGNYSVFAFHGLVNNHVYALGASGTQLLAGTLGGVSILENGVVRTSYTTSNSALTHNWITAVARVDEEWFVGTYGGGLFRLDVHGTWRRFADLTGPIEINPNAMVVTGTHVFAGTLSRGLLVYDRGTSRWTTYDAGLPSTNVTALAADHGTLVVGTDNGIVRIGEGALARP